MHLMTHDELLSYLYGSLPSQAARFSHAYAEALAKLRARAFAAHETGVPIEYFLWRRVIVDECHEPLCIGSEDAEASALAQRKPLCAMRELLGFALPDASSRPLRAQRGVFGLTGAQCIVVYFEAECSICSDGPPPGGGSPIRLRHI